MKSYVRAINRDTAAAPVRKHDSENGAKTRDKKREQSSTGDECLVADPIVLTASCWREKLKLTQNNYSAGNKFTNSPELVYILGKRAAS